MRPSQSTACFVCQCNCRVVSLQRCDMIFARRQFLRSDRERGRVRVPLAHGMGEGYPAHPITMIVPFAAGGPTDTLARILAQRMTVTLGQTIVIENVSGASGSLGVGRVARASPDGYMLSIGNVTTHVFNGAIYPLPYDLLRDFEPIAMVASNPQVLLGKREIPATTLQELIAWIKAQPGAV